MHHRSHESAITDPKRTHTNRSSTQVLIARRAKKRFDVVVLDSWRSSVESFEGVRFLS